ncbi:Hypp6359 [Branchiostoma lanceolatum]|uniref:Hypp6359 protein n=1 Tax=Branchiostoma lanceolatum TaxID=7740 RepID=A0A8K0E3U2_BRALA|nr:Hypp6359 [Branchiostoma lanceolatum]
MLGSPEEQYELTFLPFKQCLSEEKGASKVPDSNISGYTKSVPAYDQENDVTTPAVLESNHSCAPAIPTPSYERESWRSPSCCNEKPGTFWSDEDDNMTLGSFAFRYGPEERKKRRHVRQGSRERKKRRGVVFFLSQEKDNFFMQDATSTDNLNTSVSIIRNVGDARPEIPTAPTSNSATKTTVHNYQNLPVLLPTFLTSSDTAMSDHTYQNAVAVSGGWQSVAAREEEAGNIRLSMDKTDICKADSSFNSLMKYEIGNNEEDEFTKPVSLIALSSESSRPMSHLLPCLHDGPKYATSDRIHDDQTTDSVSFAEGGGPRAVESLTGTPSSKRHANASKPINYAPSCLQINDMESNIDVDHNSDGKIVTGSGEHKKENDALNALKSAMGIFRLPLLQSGHRKTYTDEQTAPDTLQSQKESSCESGHFVREEGRNAAIRVAPLATANIILQPISRAPSYLQDNHMYASTSRTLPQDDTERTAPKQNATEETTTTTSPSQASSSVPTNSKAVPPRPQPSSTESSSDAPGMQASGMSKIMLRSY